MTVHSMTGFGRARGELSSRFGAAVVIRGVNHRFLDVVVRTNLREELPEVEAAVREEIAAVAKRGRVNVQLNLERRSGGGARILVDGDVIEQILAQVRSLDLPGAVGVEVGNVLDLPGVVSVAAEDTVMNEDEIEALRGLVREALQGFTGMRTAEGRRLAVQIGQELARVREFLDWFEPRAEGVRTAILQRLRGRLANLVAESAMPDEERLVTEAALMADRADVAEELVRLRSHLETFDRRLGSEKEIGRALDFLCQEMHRELNTLGAKCREVGVADQLVEAKTAVERVREQVQNLE